MCYYTITLDHTATDEGHTRAIMITDAKDKITATAKFCNMYGPKYYNELSISEGIHVENGFERLLTEQARKYILKAKTNQDDVKSFSYHNMIQLNYA